MTDNPDNLPIKRTVLTEMANVYREADAQIRQACAAIKDAENKLNLVFGNNYREFDAGYYLRYNHLDLDEPDNIMQHMKKAAWRVLSNRMELRSILSSKRMEELNKQLEQGKDLPDITPENLTAMVEQMYGRLPEFMEESIRETHEFLRPRPCWGERYKTNSELEVGKRVILRWCVESNYAGGWRANYRKTQNLTALDNTFHVLDGKGVVKTTRGPLVDAIEAIKPGEYTGQTEYFKFKCYGNGNLHLEFKRLDLVARLNQVAGGMRLKPPTQTTETAVAA